MSAALNNLFSVAGKVSRSSRSPFTFLLASHGRISHLELTIKYRTVLVQNVLVTGGSRGIGLMIVKGYIEAGANVLLTSRDEKACAEAAASLNSPNVHFVASNVSSRDGCVALAEHTASVFNNKLDVLVNNAGTLHDDAREIQSSTTRKRCKTRMASCFFFLVSHNLLFLCCQFFRLDLPTVIKSQPILYYYYYATAATTTTTRLQLG